MNPIDLSKIGATDKYSHAVIVFQNTKKIYPKNFIETFTQNDISSQITHALETTTAKIVVSNNFHQKPTFNIFSSCAATNDAIHRICYVWIKKDALFVEEYFGARTPPYSALYPLLEKKLKRCHFKPNNHTFTIPYHEVETFIDCIDELDKDVSNGTLELYPTEKKHMLVFSQKKYYYNYAYWREKNIMQNEQAVPAANDLKELFHLISETSSDDFIANEKRIADFFSRISELQNLYNDRKAFIDNSKKIGQQL